MKDEPPASSSSPASTNMRRASVRGSVTSVSPLLHQRSASSSAIDYSSFTRESSVDLTTLASRIPAPSKRRWRPTRVTLAWVAALSLVVLYYQSRLSELTTAANAARALASSLRSRPAALDGGTGVDGFAVLDETLPNLATSSCEVCHLNPANPLCEYGYDSIRQSRAYEGSGARLRKVLAKALRGEPFSVGVLGASVTAGHSVPPGNQRWQERWFDDFKKMFPNATMHVGAIGAMDSLFFSFCFGALVPDDLDLYLVELDINNEPGLETLRDDDALMRGLLQLPQEPAVIRISTFQIIFDELARGIISSLVTSQYFDVPVIGIRNFLLPHMQHHREDAEVIFGYDQWGNRDYRHISEVGHVALADVLSLYIRKEVCETQRRALLPSPPPRKSGPWPGDDEAGLIPPLEVFSSWRKPEPPEPVIPHCQTMTGKDPLEPVSYTDDFTRIEWNGKAAWSSSTPGGQIRFNFKGTKVGLFLWVTNGHQNPEEKSDDPVVKAREAPGMGKCWVEELNDDGESSIVNPNGVYEGFELNTHIPWKMAAQSDFFTVAKGLSGGEHMLACEVLSTTTSGGTKFRVQGLASQ
ncbi:hypothetical protein Rhopal_003441-T1 [Rhodotorula paludigena]|uniref:Capsular associated protein n=1 Tax=Rhodotorula paludigena TaxID=86838 RepID=A0AAV5GKQ9_9BASI|nr:hypothetical protein Rhopal_003441-T1 [Rhodotorula paludigena]